MSKGTGTKLLTGYARVSTAEQSEDMQVAALRKAGVEDDHIVVEKVSGAKVNRPKLRGLLTELRSGDTLIVWKLDRLARSLTELLRIVGELDKKDVKLVSLTEHIDTKTAGGRFLFNVIGAAAQFERDVIAERTAAGIAVRKAQGHKYGAKPSLSPKQVERAAELRKKGMSPKKIGEKLRVSRNTIVNWTHGPGGTPPRFMYYEDGSYGPYIPPKKRKRKPRKSK